LKHFTYRIRIKPEYQDDSHPDGFCVIIGTGYAADADGILRIHRGSEIPKMYARGVWAYIEQGKEVANK
jgi:hypothetical protein